MIAAAQLCSICIDQTLEFSPAPVRDCARRSRGKRVAHSGLICTDGSLNHVSAGASARPPSWADYTTTRAPGRRGSTAAAARPAAEWEHRDRSGLLKEAHTLVTVLSATLASGPIPSNASSLGRYETFIASCEPHEPVRREQARPVRSACAPSVPPRTPPGS
jgi:hypothetical protein